LKSDFRIVKVIMLAFPTQVRSLMNFCRAVAVSLMVMKNALAVPIQFWLSLTLTMYEVW
jgi:hypothetical protein